MTRIDQSTEDHVVLPPEQARAGEKSGRMRIVLAVSTTLAAPGLVIVYAFVA